jgi:hypothetical protein
MDLIKDYALYLQSPTSGIRQCKQYNLQDYRHRHQNLAPYEVVDVVVHRVDCLYALLAMLKGLRKPYLDLYFNLVDNRFRQGDINQDPIIIRSKYLPHCT